MTYPIMLAHGIARFDMLAHNDNSDNPKVDEHHYFSGIRSTLMAQGFQVHHTRVSWTAPTHQRAEDLKADIKGYLDKTGAQKVNIIAHSAGGLDSRRMMFNDRNEGRIHEHIASLTTIGTPHWGTVFADWGIANHDRVIPLAKKLGLNLEGFKDLRTEECRRFNENPEVIAFERDYQKKGGFYQTYAGVQDILGTFTPMKVSYHIIEKEEGPNDGMVSLTSAKWKDEYFKGVLKSTDHMNQLAWWDPDQIWAGEGEKRLKNRVRQLYLDIARDLP